MLQYFCVCECVSFLLLLFLSFWLSGCQQQASKKERQANKQNKRNKEININLCTDNKDWQTNHTLYYFLPWSKTTHSKKHKNMCNFIKFSFYLLLSNH